MSDHAKGIALVAGAAFCWSLGALVVRQVDAGEWEIVFWRTASMAVAVGLYVGWTHGRGAFAALSGIGWPGVAVVLFLSASFVLFIASLARTSAGHTQVIMAAAPLASALLARAILGERIRRATWLAMVGVGCGIAVMLADSWQAGGLAGDLLAIGVAASLAGYTVSLRAGRRIDLVPAVFAAGVLTAAATLPLGAPFAIGWADAARLVFMGVVQLGLGLVLFVYGVRMLAAAEASLLTLLEAVLAPLWVWLAVGEGLSALGLVGAAAVVCALALHSLYALQRERKPPIAPPHPL